MKIKLLFNIWGKKSKKNNKNLDVKKMRKTIEIYFFYNFFIQIFVTVLMFEHSDVNIIARLLK